MLGHYKGKLIVTIHDMIHELYCDKYPENLSRKDIDKLTDIFGDDVQDVIDTLTEVMKAGSDYSIFSDANSEVDSSVKFIYKTDAIK